MHSFIALSDHHLSNGSSHCLNIEKIRDTTLLRIKIQLTVYVEKTFLLSFPTKMVSCLYVVVVIKEKIYICRPYF